MPETMTVDRLQSALRHWQDTTDAGHLIAAASTLQDLLVHLAACGIDVEVLIARLSGPLCASCGVRVGETSVDVAGEVCCSDGCAEDIEDRAAAAGRPHVTSDGGMDYGPATSHQAASPGSDQSGPPVTPDDPPGPSRGRSWRDRAYAGGEITYAQWKAAGDGDSRG